MPSGGLTETFTYTITDTDGSDSDTATLVITVSDANRSPDAVNDTNTATEGGSDVTGNVIDNDTLGDTPTTVTAIAQSGNSGSPSVGSGFTTNGGGTLVINANGTYTYTPPSHNDVPPGGLTETFTYTITDTDGSDSDTATLTITVSDVDRTPTAVNDTASATEAAKRFEAWGTALKPSWEPVVVGRKPE